MNAMDPMFFSHSPHASSVMRCTRPLLFVCRFDCLSFPASQGHTTLEDYEIHDGMGLEMYYN